MDLVRGFFDSIRRRHGCGAKTANIGSLSVAPAYGLHRSLRIEDGDKRTETIVSPSVSISTLCFT
jgi:hypothetical protein